MTSVLNSSNQAAHSIKKPEKSIHSGKHGGPAVDPSSEFAELFGALMDGGPGQVLAAPAAADGKTSPAAQGLASEVLGPSVHIITTTEPATSDESLMAFARSQGMDEEALAMIFGRKAAEAAADSLKAAVTAQAGAEATAADVLAAAGLRAKEALQAQADAAADAKQANTLDLGEDARIRWTLGDASPAKPAGEPLKTMMFGLNGVRETPPQADVAKAADVEQAAHPESARQSLAASLILGAGEASQFARRVQIKQATQRAEKLADALPKPAAAAEAPAAVDTDALAETLSLDAVLPDGDLQALLQQRQPEGRLSGNDQGQSANGSQSPQRSDIEQRTEQYDKLSQRLGEALGQRLAAQIAKGDWKVEMALRPIDLGKIDIELKMNQGQLQASFNASEAATRDLIVNGLPKLKDVLAQLGMEVASVNVNVRQEGQSGGNPTPGKPSPGMAGIGAKRSGGDTPAAAGLPPAPSKNASNDGLDLLV